MSDTWTGDAAGILPADASDALLVGRVQTPAGPSVVVLRDGILRDLSATFPTMTALTESADPAAAARAADGPSLGAFADV